MLDRYFQRVTVIHLLYDVSDFLTNWLLGQQSRKQRTSFQNAHIKDATLKLL